MKQNLFAFINNIFKNKKCRVFVLIIAGLILLIFLATRPRKSKGPEITPTPNEAVPTIEIDTHYEGSYKIQFNIDRNKLDLPKSLALYKISKDPLTEDVIESIAKNLGFTKDPFINEDPMLGTTYIYFSTLGNLSIIPRTKIIDFKSNKTFKKSFEKIPDAETIKSIALDYLVQKKLISEPDELDLYKFEPLSVGQGGHLVEHTSPNFINISFVKRVDGYPILSSIAEVGMLTVGINADNEIVSVYIDGLPDFKKDKDYPVKEYGEIVNNARKASLQSIANGKIEPFTLNKNEVQTINIDSIEIAYLQENDPDQLYLQPIFLLKGTVLLKSEKEPQTVTLYLPAISYQ